MHNSFTHVPYQDTGSFSPLATNYVGGHASLHAFFNYPPDITGLEKAMEERCSHQVNRLVLVNTLNRQYSNLFQHPEVTKNIQLLLQEDTFTICTAHQPNLLTGYLYFIYKILHAIKLAEALKQKYPSKNFVPVYYMGSEDNDIEELGTFRFRGEKYVWDGSGQSGAVGRMNTSGLKPMLLDLFKKFGPPGTSCEQLEKIITEAYIKHKTVAEATQYLVNELFGRFGLVVLNPDDAELKGSFIPVMKDELLHQQAYPIINKQIDKLSEHYKIQAQPRPINLFYLTDKLRERIELKDGKWLVLNTDISWTKDEVLSELEQHPERFSPNVMLRGLFQETILPNVAFIGGGAEVAYWMQLNTLFRHYNVFFPAIFLRQSAMWVRPDQSKLRQELGFTIAEVFKPEPELEKLYVSSHSDNNWHVNGEADAMDAILAQLKQKAVAVDATLEAASEAALSRMRYQLEVLEKKMLRAEKKKMQVQLDRISRLKKGLFPGGLQERVENFMEYYLDYGSQFLDIVKQGIDPFVNEFLVVE